MAEPWKLISILEPVPAQAGNASGNLMSLYKHTSTASSSLYIEEQMMYGSSRLGSVQLQEKLVVVTLGPGSRIDSFDSDYQRVGLTIKEVL